MKSAQMKLAAGEELTEEERALIAKSEAASESLSETYSTLLSNSTAASESDFEKHSTLLSDSTSASTLLSETNSTVLSESESDSVFISEAQSTLLSESTSASTSLSETYSTLMSESEVASTEASTKLSEAFSESASASTLASTSLYESQSTLESLNSAMSESVSVAQSEYDSLLGEYDLKEQWIKKLEELTVQIDNQRELVEAEHQKALARDDKDLSKTNYYSVASKLAELLIQYKMYTQAQINDYKEIGFETWKEYGGGNDGSYVTVTYTDKDNVKHEEYYDYVTAGSNGEAIENRNNKTSYQTTDRWGNLIYTQTENRNDATKVGCIYIVRMEKEEKSVGPFK